MGADCRRSAGRRIPEHSDIPKPIEEMGVEKKLKPLPALLPCPFCGGQAERTMLSEDGMKCHLTICTDCTGGYFSEWTSSGVDIVQFETEQTLMWNSRTVPSES
jgi:hypothetical protein